MKISRALRLVSALAVVLACTSAIATATAEKPAKGKATPTADASDPTARIRATLRERFPALQIDRIEPAPIAGLYAVITPSDVVYADPTGEHLILGHVMNTRTREDLSTQRWNQVNVVDFASLPLDLAIKSVKGNGTRRIAVFADPFCPYCRELEQEMQSLTDVTVYTFLYPLENIHPGATEKARKIWCAKDASAAWTEWMLTQKEPPTAACDAAPVAKIQELGTKLRINQTPTIVLADGHRATGAMKAAELETVLGQAR